MSIIFNASRQQLLSALPAFGFGASLTRGALVPQLAKAAGYHWLSIDSEHGTFNLAEVAQLCAACLPVGITPMVRVRSDALDEAARALDNGAQGVIIPNVHGEQEARDAVRMLRYPPLGRRNWGASGVQFAFDMPGVARAQVEMDEQILLVAMIESKQGVTNAARIAAVPGIDVLFIGAIDLSLDLEIPSQFGHPMMQQAFETVSQACRANGKYMGMGGIYDEEWTVKYMGMGAHFVAGGSDQAFMMTQAKARALFLQKCATKQ